MESLEFWDCQALIRALYVRYTEPVCETYGLTRLELDILLFLANNPQYDTASDIVETRGLTKSHVSTSIKALEQKGLLKKAYAPSNRKSVHLSLCATAFPIITDGQKAQENFFSAIFNDFRPEERVQIKKFLSRIAANTRASMNKPFS